MRAVWLVPAIWITLTSVAAIAAGSVDDCTQHTDARQRIDGCTAVVEAGDRSSAELAWAYTLRGIAYAELGRYENAIADYDLAIGHDPDATAAIYNRGRVQEILGRFAPAVADYRLALRLNPGSAAAYRSRGRVHGKLGAY